MSVYLKRRKRFLKKLLVGMSIFCLGAGVVSLTSFVFRHHFPSSWINHPVFPILIMTLVSLVAYKPLDIAFTQLFKNYFFRKKSFRHISLMKLAEELSLILDLQELSNLVVNTFGEVLQLKSVALLVPNRRRGDYEIASAYGWNISEARKIRLTDESPLLTLLHSSGPHVLVRDQAVRVFSWQEANRLSQDFDNLQANWVIPLFVADDLTGAIAFSAFRPDCVFDESDFQFFREFAFKVAKCVRNAMIVSELKLTNCELQDAQSQLLQNTKLAAIEQLASGIAHEIHNPLTIISGKAQVLLLQKNRNFMDEKVEEVLKTIVKQTKRAADITRKLLMFSQGSGAPREYLSLEQTLSDTLALVSYQTSLEGIEISRTVHPGIPPYYGNVHELREVFFNLILNAVQSVGSHGKIRIEMSYRGNDSLVEIQIADTGKGIQPQHIDKLFNPFFTTRSDAVGLGLFVTQQIVHRYGGSIRVESRPDEGSLFIVQLPYASPSDTGFSKKDSSYSMFPKT